jgi:hypothetical protein
LASRELTVCKSERFTVTGELSNDTSLLADEPCSETPVIWI